MPKGRSIAIHPLRAQALHSQMLAKIAPWQHLAVV